LVSPALCEYERVHRICTRGIQQASGKLQSDVARPTLCVSVDARAWDVRRPTGIYLM